MVWHARRRLSAMTEMARVSDANLRLLERERRFIQDASHELRTPITVALGQVELLQRAADGPQLQEDAAIAVDELMRLRRLSERLLLLASAEDPDLLHHTRVDVDGLLSEALRRWASTPRVWAPAVLSRDHGRGGSRTAPHRHRLVDRERGEVHPGPGDRIALAAERRRGAVAITVSDSGPGSPRRTSPICSTGSRGSTRAEPGRPAGSGWACRSFRAVAEAHGGAVEVQSVPGAGSRFSITIPLAASGNGSVT